MPGFEANTPSILAALAQIQSTLGIDQTQRGFVSYSGPPQGTNASVLTAGSEIAVKLWLPQSGKITGVAVGVSSAGVALTSGQNLITLYAADGTLVGQTADQTTPWATTGNKYASFTGGPFTLPSGVGAYCWCSVLSNAGTTPVGLRALNQTQSFAVIGPGADLIGANLPCGRVGAGGTTVPASFNPASALVQTQALLYWIGLY